MNILNLIPHGRENAISRAELVRRAGVTDRLLRKNIKRLVSEGYPILSSSQGRGYWLSEDIAEIESFIRECDSRSRSEYLTTRKLRLMVARAKGERFIPVRAHTRRIPSNELPGQELLGGQV